MTKTTRAEVRPAACYDGMVSDRTYGWWDRWSWRREEGGPTSNGYVWLDVEGLQRRGLPVSTAPLGGCAR